VAKSPINVTITGDYNDRDIKKAIKDLQSLQGQSANTEQSFTGLGKISGMATAAIATGAAAAGYALLNLGKDAIMAASDFGEVQNKVQQVFGPGGQATLNEWAESANTAMGLSKTAALDAAATFGIFGKSAGLAGDSLNTFSTDLTSLAGDLASFNNTTVDEAIQALGAGLRGESEPLRRFGVLLDDATLKARAMEMGIYNGSGALSQQQRVLAAQAEILAQTTVQQGDFSRTADGLANTMRVLSASVDNAKIAIGQGLYYAVDGAIQSFGGSAGLAQTIEDTADSVADLTYGIGGIIRKLNELGATAAEANDDSQGLLKTIQDLILNSPLVGRGFIVGAKAIQTYGNAEQLAAEAASNQANEIARLTLGIKGYIPAVQQATRDNYSFVRSTGAATDRMTAQARALGADISFTGGTLDEWKRRSEEAATSTGGLGSATAKAKTSFADLRKELLASIEDSPAEKYGNLITQLKDNLRDAEQTFINFKDSVVSSITQAFSFGDAYQAAQESGMSFLDALTKQAESAVGFADRIKQLVILGLSPEALQQVLAAGVTAGTGIANQLIEGGATAIEQTNRLVETSTAAADEVALLAASAYYGAGVKSAQDTLDGFAADLGPGGPSNKRMQRIMDNLAASLNRTSVITVITKYETQGTPPAAATPAVAGSIPGLAAGGIVTGPTIALIGEAGPEAVIPLDRNMTAKGGTTINLTVNAGMGTNGAEVGRQIVDALKQYERRNGPVPITVA
jgi:hypothetical protein